MAISLRIVLVPEPLADHGNLRCKHTGGWTHLDKPYGHVVQKTRSISGEQPSLAVPPTMS